MPKYKPDILNMSIQSASLLQKMPKIELHAHLFGSITQNQLLTLLKQKGHMAQYHEFKEIKESLNFNNIFDKAFTYLPSIVGTIDDLRLIVRDVLQNFISDNVIYIELRSSPKKLANATFEDYFKCIIEEFKTHSHLITARFIVSINRGVPASQYDQLIAHMVNADPGREFIVGLDYSGDARSNNFNDYKHIMEEARDSGYKITLHTPELESGIAELNDIIGFRPDRLGHFVFYTEEQLQKVKELGIPIEICPTSNYIVRNKNSHHFIDLINSGITRYTICTDDILLFKANLSQEWMMFMENTKLDIPEVYNAVYQSVDYIFDDKVKDLLRMKLREFEQTYLGRKL